MLYYRELIFYQSTCRVKRVNQFFEEEKNIFWDTLKLKHNYIIKLLMTREKKIAKLVTAIAPEPLAHLSRHL